MTVLVGLIDATCVAVLADRAAVYAGTDLGDGTPMFADDVVKVAANGRGLVSGVAGLAELGGVDVISTVGNIINMADAPVEAASAVHGFLAQVAHVLVPHPAVGDASQDLVVVVFVGGWDDFGPTLWAVGLDAGRDPHFARLHDSRAIVPKEIRHEADTYLQQDVEDGLSVPEQLVEWGSRLSPLGVQAAIRARTPITLEHDLAVASAPTASLFSTGQVLPTPKPFRL